MTAAQPDADLEQRLVDRDRRAMVQSPVDDATYDLLVILTSKLEAISMYGRSMADDGGSMADDTHLFELYRRLADEDAVHVRLLIDALSERLGLASAPRQHARQPVGYGGPTDPTMQHGRGGLPDG